MQPGSAAEGERWFPRREPLRSKGKMEELAGETARMEGSRLGPPLWLDDVLRAWLFALWLPFFAAGPARPGVFVSTGGNWASTRLLAGKTGQLFGRYDVAVLADFARLLAVVRLILVPCWDASCQG